VPGGTEEIHKKPQKNQCPVWDLNQPLPEYSLEALVLESTCSLSPHVQYIQSAPGRKVNILEGYICPTPNGFWDRAISFYSSLDLEPNTILPSRMWIGVKHQLATSTADSDIVGVLWKIPHIFTKTDPDTDMLFAVLTRVAKCIEPDGGIFENVLH
jgi:hypothetical protein